MKKNDGWINALFALVFIAAPALLLYYFFLPAWTDKEVLSYFNIWLIALGFLLYVVIFSWLLIHFEWLTIESLNFNVPISLALMVIFVTYPLPFWAMSLFVLAAIFIAFPVNMWTTKYRERSFKKKSSK